LDAGPKSIVHASTAVGGDVVEEVLKLRREKHGEQAAGA
jgi:hypothetical protein